MIKQGMYVRVPIDFESKEDPRQFALGFVETIDELGLTVKIKYNDPFNYGQFYETDLLPTKFNINDIEHCVILKNATVIFDNSECKVITRKLLKEGDKAGYYSYSLFDVGEKIYRDAIENEIIAPFTAADSNPVSQMKNFEFQNPRFYFGRQVAKKTMTVLENSVYGFKELVGCKIFLKAYQLETIMRCVQSKPCRYMLADEVGLGKTIEACSILKIFLSEHVDQNVLIVVPPSLMAQWKTELLFKFNILDGLNTGNNLVEIKAINEIESRYYSEQIDFLIVDEVHNYLFEETDYKLIHKLSASSDNVLLLSATPVQHRFDEYLNLLRLVNPAKYDDLSIDDFKRLNEKQDIITKNVYEILDDVARIKTDCLPNISNDPSIKEDIDDLLDEIFDDLNSIFEIVEDEQLNRAIESINRKSEDYGLYNVQVVVSYICDNYQLDESIIRGRRLLLGVYPSDENGEFSQRELISIPEYIDENHNYYEYDVYNSLVNHLKNNQELINSDTVNNLVKPLLSSFFSSPWAFSKTLNSFSDHFENDTELLNATKRWVYDEDEACKKLSDHLDENSHSSKLLKLIDFIDNLEYGKKVVIFTSDEETFLKYNDIFLDYYGEDSFTSYGALIEKDQAEINMYKFQSNDDCYILLCDKTGGEGRNLQNADFVIHTDLPWDINEVEQRIGRLDRLGRDVKKPVTSVVIYDKNTYEEQLFELWNNGLKVFNQSLSGLEIILNEINKKIESAMTQDFESGLIQIIPELIDYTKKTRETVYKEQMFDVASKKYKPLYVQLRKIISDYEFNENQLFEKSMMSWALTSGFEGFDKSNRTKTVIFNEHRFSPRAAENTYLIPPNQEDYFTRKQNLLAINAQRGIKSDDKNIVRNNRTIKGTFDRETAIKNDYIHFFAPGDEIFDCIINNAESSYKGKACALAYGTKDFDWLGFVYTFSISPRESVLVKNNISQYEISQYRSYLSTSLITVLYPLKKCSDQDLKLARKYYNFLMENGYPESDSNDRYDHLGRRGKSGGFLYDHHRGISNIDWFKSLFPPENWAKYVDSSYKYCFNQALKVKDAQSDIGGAKQAMEGKTAALEYANKYYDNKIDLSEVKEKNKHIIESLENPLLKVESICLLWLKKYE